MSVFLDLKGTTETSWQLGKGGPKLQATAGDFHFHAPNLVDYVDMFANVLHATGNELVLNANAPNTGNNRKYTIKRPTAGMSAALTLHLPPNYGSSGQFLTTDGAGNTSWTTGGGGGTNTVYRGFGVDGFVTNLSNAALPVLITATGTILSVKGYLRTAGTTCDFDIKKNGVSIFSTLPSFGSNQLSSGEVLSTTALAADDVLELDLSNVTGSPQVLTITIRIQE
jgi:hypothetical protein